jgi:hypothetical protein
MKARSAKEKFPGEISVQLKEGIGGTSLWAGTICCLLALKKK